MDSTQIKPEVKSTDSYLPPRPSILSLSLGSSGLWSCVTSTALTKSSLGSSWTPSTTPESPTWATYIFDPRIITTLAVVPDVLGRPVMVFGHSAAVRKKANKNTFVFNAAETVTFWRSRLCHRGLHVTTGCAHNYGAHRSSPPTFTTSLPQLQLKLKQSQCESTETGFQKLSPQVYIFQALLEEQEYVGSVTWVLTRSTVFFVRILLFTSLPEEEET